MAHLLSYAKHRFVKQPLQIHRYVAAAMVREIAMKAAKLLTVLIITFITEKRYQAKQKTKKKAEHQLLTLKNKTSRILYNAIELGCFVKSLNPVIDTDSNDNTCYGEGFFCS